MPNNRTTTGCGGYRDDDPTPTVNDPFCERLRIVAGVNRISLQKMLDLVLSEGLASYEDNLDEAQEDAS